MSALTSMISLRLPSELADRLDAVTKLAERSRGDVVREAIMREVERIEVAALARKIAGDALPPQRKRARNA